MTAESLSLFTVQLCDIIPRPPTQNINHEWSVTEVIWYMPPSQDTYSSSLVCC